MARARQGEAYLANVGGRIGFVSEPKAAAQLVLVVQGNVLNGVLATVQVAPLLRAAEALPFSMNVPIPGRELAGRGDHVALVHLVRPIALSRLQPGPLSTVSDPTLGQVLAMLARVFQ